MAKDASFDIVSDYDAVDQTQRELGTRYDFKGTSAEIDFVEGKKGVLIKGDSTVQLNSVLDVFQSKLVKRGISLKVIDISPEPVQGGKEMRWTLPFQQGLDQDKAKKITKVIREEHPKVKTQIQGDAVRATSASRDELQAVMATLNAQEFDFPLNYENYR
jgi:uncharacterized protein YajQ (UPF0234 family)